MQPLAQAGYACATQEAARSHLIQQDRKTTGLTDCPCLSVRLHGLQMHSIARAGALAPRCPGQTESDESWAGGTGNKTDAIIAQQFQQDCTPLMVGKG